LNYSTQQHFVKKYSPHSPKDSSHTKTTKASSTMSDSTAEPRFITRKELEDHDEDAERQWVLIDNNVVDITDYKHQHPGGDEILLEHAGADATESFNNVGHSKEARETTKTYIIGQLHPDDRVAAKPTESNSDKNDAAEESSGSGIGGIIKYALIPAVIFAGAFYIQKLLQSST
jgi:cytochrome b involved in lipid metabolism